MTSEHLRAETLVDYLHGALPAETDAKIHAHLQACAECRKEHDAEAALSEQLRAYATATQRELPSAIKAEIWNRIRAARPSPIAVFAARLRPALSIPIAAAIALAAYFGATSLGSHGAPAIEAAYYLQDHAAMAITVPFSDRGEASPANLETQAALGPTQIAINVETPSYTADAAP